MLDNVDEMENLANEVALPNKPINLSDQNDPPGFEHLDMPIQSRLKPAIERETSKSNKNYSASIEPPQPKKKKH